MPHSLLAETLSIFDKLKAFSVYADFIDDFNDETDYCLLLLDINEGNILIENFHKQDLALAATRYADLEKQHKNDSNIDVVLVAAESIKNLKKAYPNYFADSNIFLEKLNAILNYPDL